MYHNFQWKRITLVTLHFYFLFKRISIERNLNTQSALELFGMSLIWSYIFCKILVIIYPKTLITTSYMWTFYTQVKLDFWSRRTYTIYCNCRQSLYLPVPSHTRPEVTCHLIKKEYEPGSGLTRLDFHILRKFIVLLSTLGTSKIALWWLIGLCDRFLVQFNNVLNPVLAKYLEGCAVVCQCTQQHTIM